MACDCEADAAPRVTHSTMRSTAGCQGEFSSASEPSIRSAAIVYWVRSLVPRDTKSTRSRICSAVMAAAGVSTITPLTGSPAAWTSSRKWAASATVAIMGAMTRTSAELSAAAAAMASSCRARTPGVLQSVR